ncbi:hypothetical protein THASP1DRAFT_27788 [Thamnocephalis sphaerospora]|uniref:BSD domain-containing protein n=1 Tax=Thamnocephalis sphaerospora TaxID=78915 RepID=A0A4P9XVV0_9FUNG|nr:hypothetical protein THASP1DRAFT_27788 [Thamnocephalis sphaerospora]|eukprot:RKP10417.1 hypothetical protein THASP1DRAFT_27788 [Thamnocephalis sphaerospora]
MDDYMFYTFGNSTQESRSENDSGDAKAADGASETSATGAAAQTASSWRPTSWAQLVQTVKQQSESALQATRRDFGELARSARQDAQLGIGSLSSGVRQLAVGVQQAAGAAAHSIGDVINETAGSMPSRTASATEAALPADSAHSPQDSSAAGSKFDLLTGMVRSSTRAINSDTARQYADRATSGWQEFVSQVGSLITFDDIPDSSTVPASTAETSKDAGVSDASAADETPQRIFVDRKEARLAALHRSNDIFLSDPGERDSAQVRERFVAFQDFFSSEARSRDISDWLSRYPELRARMVDLVPVQVPYEVFWLRYCFRIEELEREHARRVQLLKELDEQRDDDGFSWDMDDPLDETTPSIASTKAPSLALPSVATSALGLADDFSEITVTTPTSLLSDVLDPPTQSLSSDLDSSALPSPLAQHASAEDRTAVQAHMAAALPEAMDARTSPVESASTVSVDASESAGTGNKSRIPGGSQLDELVQAPATTKAPTAKEEEDEWSDWE